MRRFSSQLSSNIYRNDRRHYVALLHYLCNLSRYFPSRLDVKGDSNG